MTQFPDPFVGSVAYEEFDKSGWQLFAEGVIAPNNEVEILYWDFATAPFTNVDGQSGYPIPQSLKTFHVFPVWPGCTFEVVSVGVDMPREAPDTLRYAITIANRGPNVGGYRLFLSASELTNNGSQMKATV